MADEHEVETPRERRRRFDQYLIFTGILVFIAAVSLILVLVLDEDTGDNSATAVTTTTQPTPTTPEGYAKATYDAWKAGDRSAAATYASPEAVDQLFAVPYAPVQSADGPTDPLHVRDCEGAAGSTICSWSGEDDARIVITVRNDTGGLPILVVHVQRASGGGAT
jgi:hypothetical protein